MGRRLTRSLVCIGAGLATVALLRRDPSPPPLSLLRMPVPPPRSYAAEPDEDGDACDQDTERPLQLPSGAASALACDDARQIVAQARATLAATPPGIDAARFAAATSDWLDPHGMWSVAPDAPVGAAVRASADALLAELQAAPGSGPCRAATAIGTELTAWSTQLRAVFDQGLAEGRREPPRPASEVWNRAARTPFEDGRVTQAARELARAVGRDLGALEATYGDALAPFVEATRERTAPGYDADAWGRVVVAAALRAYIPQLDAHGAWAPLDEEMSIYDLGLEVAPPPRLWTEMTRTVIGVRIDRGAAAPLLDGDVVLRANDVALGGVSVEQAEQLSVLGDRPAGAARVTVLRKNVESPLELVVAGASGPAAAPAASGALELEMTRYADGRAAVVVIPDVPDDLGNHLAAVLEKARAGGELRGVVLDVRANGGGSTDGAVAALGLFLPGVSLFPMRRRDGSVEVERAPDVPEQRRYTGPLAVLVDGDSASAAEMIAGAVGSYHRGLVVGDRTYGKGCAQEYLDDDAHAGVLRLTTLLFALPDGSPVQKVGVAPQLGITLPPVREREASTTHALGPWRGPDVRDHVRARDVAWPAHGGRVGPCNDEVVCRALRALGAAPAAAR